MLIRSPAALLLISVLALAPGTGLAQSCPLEPPLFAGHAFPSQGSPLDSADFALVNAFPTLSFDRPVFLTSPADGTDRNFVVEQAGRIRVFPNDPSTTATQVFLDLTQLVQAAGLEQGLLGFAFDPGYATNGYFYVNYTAPASSCRGNTTECTKIVRYRVSAADANRADSLSALELLEYSQPTDVHNAGMLGFGPDAMLYIASGDGGERPGLNGQDLTQRLGKILRIDPSAPAPYVPADNPFSSDATKAAEIWHYGLRNPWRFSFDRATGDLWIGDVGEDGWEEVDFFPAGHAGGANLGWYICEGNHDFGGECAALVGATGPVFEYSHASGMGNVIVGGYVYRGAAYPGMIGAYVFGDGGSGRVFAWDRIAAPVDVGIVPFVSSFGEDAQGELYALSLYEGRIYRIEHTPGGEPGEFPILLSQTGLFADVASLTPAPGLVEYEIVVPFWSDNAIKRRWIALPIGERAVFRANGAWELPEGTAVVKHFEVPIGPGQTRRLETRVLLHQPATISNPARWFGFTYRWNTAQTDAELITTGLEEEIEVDLGSGLQAQSYHYPAAWECTHCHNAAAGHLLGLRTAQMNRSIPYPGGGANQLTAWWCAGMLDTEPGNPADHEVLVDPANAAGGVGERARSWLDVNCSICHRPAGPAPGNLDLRRERLLGQMNVIDALPTQGDLGIAGARRILPGSKEQSVLWVRVQSAEQGVHMPPQSRAADPLATSLLGAWIDTGLLVLDTDADGFPDESDNCPHVGNDQTDSGAIGPTSPPDGIGNACQCGDVWNDGVVTLLDATELRFELAGFAPPPALELCNVFDPPSGPKSECDLVDAVVLRRTLSGKSPEIAPVCRAAGGVP